MVCDQEFGDKRWKMSLPVASSWGWIESMWCNDTWYSYWIWMYISANKKYFIKLLNLCLSVVSFWRCKVCINLFYWWFLMCVSCWNHIHLYMYAFLYILLLTIFTFCFYFCEMSKDKIWCLTSEYCQGPRAFPVSSPSDLFRNARSFLLYSNWKVSLTVCAKA